MPELPEVETIVRDLDRLLRGATIDRVDVLRPDLLGGQEPSAFQQALEQRRIEAVTRRAKNIVVDLDADRLIVNLGMTGRWVVQEPESDPPGYIGVRFILADGRAVFYCDVRRFGRLEVMSAADWEARERSMGVEPLSEDFSGPSLHALTRTSRVAVKSWLMDQRWVVGIGNIYASEALFRARIDPRRPAQRLTRPQAVRLVDGIREVLLDAIEFRGTTLLDYRDASGARGGFAERLLVYGRAGEPCRRCGTPIRRIVQAGRSTFFCPHCQR